MSLKSRPTKTTHDQPHSQQSTSVLVFQLYMFNGTRSSLISRYFLLRQLPTSFWTGPKNLCVFFLLLLRLKLLFHISKLNRNSFETLNPISFSHSFLTSVIKGRVGAPEELVSKYCYITLKLKSIIDNDGKEWLGKTMISMYAKYNKIRCMNKTLIEFFPVELYSIC